MKTRFLLIGMLLAMITANLCAQTEFDVSRITIINIGDGRSLFRELRNNKPLSGEHRIIDGYKTEYVLAEFNDGLYNGSYQLFKHNKLSEKGSYKEGWKDGDWFEYFSDESVKSEYHCKKGKLDGIRKTYYTDGKTESEIGYKDGVQDGKEIRYDYETGKLKVEAFFVNGKPDGKQTRYISSNVGDYVQISNYKNGLQNGEYSETNANGNIRIKGSYKDGKKDGLWVENRKDGKPDKSITYKNGLRNGESISYYTGGSIEKRVLYANDVKEGITKEFDYNSGKLKSEYTFSNDKKDGPYKLYSVDGNLREEGRCENGSEVYSKSYYSNGKIKEIREQKSRGWVTLESYDETGAKIAK
jgi:antitoxin component YwqK of YwqJK toxin-antitoxin module